MKIHFKLIIVLAFLFSAGSVFSQTEKIELGLIPNNTPLVCRTDSNTRDKFKVFVPAQFQPNAASSREITESETTRNQILFRVFSFSYSSQTETATCRPVRDGFEIVFSPTNAPVAGEGGGINPNPQNNNQQNNPQNNPQNNQQAVNLSQPSPAAAPKLAETVANKKKEVDKEAADLSVPESPGFTILGLTPQTVIRPATPREFATAIINSLDENGNFQSGVAIDTAPYLLFFGNNVTLGEYRGNFRSKDRTTIVKKPTLGYMNRLFSRTQFSLATTKGTTADDKSAKIGAGLHVVLFDYGDPRLDTELDACFVRITNLIRERAKIEVPDFLTSGAAFTRYEAAIERLVEANRADYKVCIEESRERNFASSSLVIGGAGSWISKNGDSSKFTDNGAGFWGSLAYGFEGISAFDCTKKQEEARDNNKVSERCIKPQLIVHFRRRIKETVPDPLQAGMFTTKDSNLAGVRLRVGVPDWSLNFEGIYKAERYAGHTSSSNIRMSFGADYKLASDLYLNFSIGGETKKSNISDNKVFVRTSFNWGTSSKPLNN